ncbi:hypothetical protein B0H17DRAFT_1183985 [Mycena rosella]|uniref:Uncharacterized protein n=1 Tax=Mycena rosella TaxID=1033263 RepID=A0AAD7G9D6_MYCRO|nr:hypothetical protein B0H17DRAFT_1183985 [Mycena rosella]
MYLDASPAPTRHPYPPSPEAATSALVHILGKGKAAAVCEDMPAKQSKKQRKGERMARGRSGGVSANSSLSRERVGAEDTGYSSSCVSYPAIPTVCCMWGGEVQQLHNESARSGTGTGTGTRDAWSKIVGGHDCGASVRMYSRRADIGDTRERAARGDVPAGLTGGVDILDLHNDRKAVRECLIGRREMDVPPGSAYAYELRVEAEDIWIWPSWCTGCASAFSGGYLLQSTQFKAHPAPLHAIRPPWCLHSAYQPAVAPPRLSLLPIESRLIAVFARSRRPGCALRSAPLQYPSRKIPFVHTPRYAFPALRMTYDATPIPPGVTTAAEVTAGTATI